MENMTEELFLREVIKKYHFSEEQLLSLAAVAREVQSRVRADNGSGLAGWTCGHMKNHPNGAFPEFYAAVCITLGGGMDALQDAYLASGRLSEGYMAEALASEILLRSYPCWNREAERLYGAQVRRYHFLGSEPEIPLTGLPGLLAALDVPVTCNEAYCMIPRKSVAFYAELAAASDGGKILCEGICAGCGNRGCPNRMERQSRQIHADHVFTYGYQRIFGIQ